MTNEHKLLMSLSAIVLCLLALFLAAKTWQSVREAQQVGEPVPYEYMISIEGIGEATAVPNLAKFMYSVESRGSTTEDAQNKNASIGNAIIEGLTKDGIEKKDIKTTYYNSYQNYTYDANGNSLPGGDWSTTQSVEVTIRDISKSSSILTLLGQLGATGISGPSFEVEDDTQAMNAARLLAIDDVKSKAELIASKFNLKLKKMSGYSEYADAPYYGYDGKGGMGAMNTQATNPTISPGEQEIKLRVSASYTFESSGE